MATTSTNIYWSKDFALGAVSASATFAQLGEAVVSFTALPDPPHECDVIQRMSEAWRAIKNR